jgi:prepilin-type N-terminal cleavage/methylation domain-containing protein
MKLFARFPARLHRGFTLIELLVVIGIVAILAGVATPILITVMRKGYESQARNMMEGLKVAIEGYKAEYNHYPNPDNNPTTGNQPIDTMKDTGLIACLMGSSGTSSSLGSKPNPRNIQFYNPPIAKNGKNGFDSTTGNLYDPWGSPMWVLMDLGGQGYLANPYYGTSSYPSETQENLNTGCIVWDFGADGIDGKSSQSTDDLRSWH